jgi:hypothetical protein
LMGLRTWKNSRGRNRILPSRGLRATCFSRGRNRISFYSLRLTVDGNWHPRFMSFKTVH